MSHYSKSESNERKIRSDALPEEQKKLVQDFFNQLDISSLIPDEKTVPKYGERRVLNRPLTDIWKEFKQKHSDVKVGFLTFAFLKPLNIQSTKQQPWFSCLCDVCTNVELKLAPICALITKKKLGSTMPIKDKYKALDTTFCTYEGKYAKKIAIVRTVVPTK